MPRVAKYQKYRDIPTVFYMHAYIRVLVYIVLCQFVLASINFFENNK